MPITIALTIHNRDVLNAGKELLPAGSELSRNRCSDSISVKCFNEAEPTIESAGSAGGAIRPPPLNEGFPLRPIFLPAFGHRSSSMFSMSRIRV